MMRTDFTSLGVDFEIPHKSDLDIKECRIIRLPNKLTALLVSNLPNSVGNVGVEEEEEKMAFVALNVTVGSFSDPPNAKGLSHFLEHMIFMGSEKYPDENEFTSFIQYNGGMMNATTSCADTTFYMTIPENNLEDALDRFGQLFTAPLLLRNSLTKEREILHSEYLLRMHDDDVRLAQFIAHLANPDHPVNHFTCGNLTTLRGNITDDELYRLVHNHRRQHYSAHKMYLYVETTRSLDFIEDMVRRNFCDIPSNNLPPMDFSQFNEINAFRTDFTNRIYFVKPVDNIRKIQLTWCLRSFQRDFKTKPHKFVVRLLSSQEKGSLLNYLQKKLWAIDLSVSASDDCNFNSIYSLITISINLTKNGFANIKKVVSTIFSYLKTLLQTQGDKLEILFREARKIEEASFKYLRRNYVMENSKEFLSNLKLYPPKYVFTGSKLYFEYDEEAIRGVIIDLNRKKCNITILSSKPYSEVTYDQKEPFFGTEYTSWYMPLDWSSLYTDAQILPELYLPEPNQFIVDDFTILYQNNADLYSADPENIIKNDFGELWFKPDHKFRLPLAYVLFQLISPLSRMNNVHFSILKDLYVKLLQGHLTKKFSACLSAGMHFNVYSDQYSLFLYITGYNQKLPFLVDFITREMILFIDDVSDEMFANIVEAQKKIYEKILTSPMELNSEIFDCVLDNNFRSSLEKHNVIDSTKVDFLELFTADFFKELKLKALIQGNIHLETAKNIFHKILENLNCEIVRNESDLLFPRTIELPVGANCIRVKSFNITNVNSSTIDYYQIGPSTIKNTCLNELLINIIKPKIIQTLSTEEQLGYVVQIMTNKYYGIEGYKIMIFSQEDKFSLAHIQSRIKEFMKTTLKIIEDMSDEEFQQIRNSMINIQLIADNDLSDEVDRNWDEIKTGQYNFSRKKKMAKYFARITKKNIISFYRNYSFDNKREMLFQVRGKVNTNEEPKTNTVPEKFELQIEQKVIIKDIAKFKQNLPHYSQ